MLVGFGPVFFAFRRFIRAAAGATALAVEQSHFRVLLAS